MGDMMYRELNELLKNATGVSEFVIAINADIRGFSEFSKKVESPETAIYIKTVYNSIINNYFPDAVFFKPTGDGLIIIINYDEDNLKEIAQKTIDECLKLVLEFKDITSHNRMINFEVPDNIGIGISRGASSRIISGDNTIDYSGRTLNLTSRLMDLARPSGIVFDSDFDILLLSEEQKVLFEEDSVYLKGIAEDTPVDIYYSKEYTQILPSSKEPISAIKYNTTRLNDITMKEIKNHSPLLAIHLQTKPVDVNKITVRIKYPKIKKGKINHDSYYYFENFRYDVIEGIPQILIDMRKMKAQLVSRGVKDNWKVKISITVPELNTDV